MRGRNLLTRIILHRGFVVGAAATEMARGDESTGGSEAKLEHRARKRRLASRWMVPVTHSEVRQMGMVKG